MVNAINTELPIPITDGGTGQITRQAAIDALTDASSATLGQALTIDGSGNAVFETPQLPVQDNNSFLQWRNAADDADLDVLKVDGSDNTILNALTGKEIQLQVNSTTEWLVDSSGNLVPGADNVNDIGTPSVEVKRINVRQIESTGAALAINSADSINLTAAGFGDVRLYAGTNTTGTNARIEFYTGNPSAGRWTIENDGDLFPAVADTHDIGSTTFRVSSVYCTRVRNALNSNLDIYQDGTLPIRMIVNDVARFQFDTVKIDPALNNTYDIGSGVRRIRTIYSVNALDTSDERLKDNISPIDKSSALTKIDSLNPICFKFVSEYDDGSDRLRCGFKAQEVYSHIPEAVVAGDNDSNKVYGDEGFETWSMQQVHLLPYIVGAIQKLKEENDELKARLDILENP